MDCMDGLVNSTIVIMLITLFTLINAYFKNDDDENKKVEIVLNKINDDVCELSDISDWGQYVIIDD